MSRAIVAVVLLVGAPPMGRRGKFRSAGNFPLAIDRSPRVFRVSARHDICL